MTSILLYVNSSLKVTTMTLLNLLSKQKLDKSKPIPLYFQLKDIFIELINNATLLEGDWIPTELELCTLYNISRTTVRQAILELVDEGYLSRVKGNGTFVAYRKNILPIYTTESKFSLSQQVNKQIFLGYRHVLANAFIAQTLELGNASEILQMRSIQYSKDCPIALHDLYIPFMYVKKNNIQNISYDLLDYIIQENVHLHVHHSINTIDALQPTKEDCDLLNISKSTAIIQINKTYVNHSNTPVLFEQIRYRSDKNTFSFNTNFE